MQPALFGRLSIRIRSSAFLKKVVQGTFWMSLGSVVSGALMSLASVLLARLLSQSEYGEFGMVKSTIDNFLIFASMGIGLTTTKYISELKDTNKAQASRLLGTALGLVLPLSLAVALLLAGSSNYLATVVLGNANLQLPLVLGGFTLVFVAVNGTQLGALLGLQAYRSNAVSTSLQGLFLFAGLSIGAYSGGVTGALVGNLIGIVLVSVLLQFLLRRETAKQGLQISFKNFRQNAKIIYKFALPASLSTFIVAPTLWILNSMLVNQPAGYAALGLYSAVLIFGMAIQLFNGAIGNALLPLLLSKTEAVSPAKAFFNYFGPWFISIGMALPLLLLPELVSLVLGHKYPIEQVLPVLALVLLSTFIIANRGGIARELIVQNRMWLSVFSMGQWAMTTLAAFYFLKDAGAVGFAAALAIGYALNYLLLMPFFIRWKLAPAYLFYNWQVWGVWMALLGLLYLPYAYFDQLLVRGLGALLLLLILCFSIYQLYRSCLKR